MRELTCDVGGITLRVPYTDFAKEVLERALRAFSLSFEEAACELAKPMTRYYARVNTLKVTPDDLVGRLRASGLGFRRDNRLYEAIYAVTEGPFELEAPRGSYVVVDRFTAESVMMGANVYAPGVLKIKGEVGGKVAVIDKTGTVVGVGRLVSNPLKTGARKGLVVDVEASLFRAPKLRELPEYSEGFITDQSLPSMTVARSLEPGPGDVVVDLTASPGGKVTHAYEVARGEALVIGVDRSEKKVEVLKRNVERLGHRILTIVHDSRHLPEVFPLLKSTRTIVDPPCTALGRRPRTTLVLTRRDLESLVALQRSLLSAASRVTTAEGVISYSTCTLTVEENEDVVGWARRELGLRPTDPAFPILPGYPLADTSGARFVPGLSDTPGFFITLLKKGP